MFFILKGAVEIELTPEPVKLGPGQFFGEIALVKDSTRLATVTAIQDTHLLALDVNDFRRLMAQMPDLKAIAGKPLPVQDLPPGSVGVRVARQAPSNPVAGVEVTAVITAAGGDARKRTAKTGADGRATFEGI